jgi:hypothetical protein
MRVKTEKWFGRAEVVPLPGSDVLLPGSGGAFVNIVAIADGLEHFKQEVRRILADYKLGLVALEGCEPFASRVLAGGVGSFLLSEAERITPETTYAFGSFHNYPPTALA